jgi:CheY-like chemotaxis protein
MAARVEQAARAESLGILAGGVAHDFNNLLVAMLGNADLALREVAPSSPARAALRNIKLAGQRAAELTNQLLAYAGKGQFEVREVHVNQLISELAEILRVSLAKHATLLVDLEPGIATVRADPSQVRQIVLNLITNASDALGDRTGSIIVRTSMVRLDEAAATAFDVAAELRSGAYVSIEISDTGCGIDAATRRRIFDPFFTTKSSGHGLGLAAVLGIVRAHHGAIRVLSEPDRGATFEVVLPAAAESAWATRAELAVGSSAAPRRGITAMVVDDDVMVSNVLCRMLEELGCDTVSVGDGASALAAFAAGRQVDVLFLDLTMPQMSGVEVLRRVHEARPELPIVVCSGYEESPLPDVGVAGFVRKPFHLETLEHALAQVVAR